MPTERRPVTQEQVLLDWYRSERDVDWQREHRLPFEQWRVGRAEQDIGNEGIRFLKGALLQCRSRPEPFFDAYPTVWFTAQMTSRELADATAIDCWGPAAPKTVRETVARVARLRDIDRRGRANGGEHRLIVVSTHDAPNAKLILLDGYHRSASLIRANVPAPICVYWGICPQLTDWDYYR
jgi:hypothetical protein